MILRQCFVVCENPDCGYRLPGSEYPTTWPSIVEGRQRAYFCSRACLQQCYDKPVKWLHPYERYGLTARDVEWIQCVAEGLSDSEIAFKYGLSFVRTHHHMAEIRNALNANGRPQLVARACARGLIDCGQIERDLLEPLKAPLHVRSASSPRVKAIA